MGSKSTVILSALCVSALAVPGVAVAGGPDQLGGWEVLQPSYETPSPLDFASYEWEYFTVQNEDGSFLGIVGYVLADPRGSGGSVALVPPGGNMAVGGIRPGQSATAEFLTFGLENTDASANEKYLLAEDPNAGTYGLIMPDPTAPANDPALILQGRSDLYEWDLVVREDFKEFRPLIDAGGDAAFSPVLGDDVGILPEENWTIDAVWPRTKVTGTFTDLNTGEIIPIDAKGYRENSYGRYLLSIDGWDFAVFSDTQNRVQTMLQTYHRSEKIDYFDISFYDEGVPKNVRFRPSRDELGWYHPKWTWDGRAKQCVPEVTWFVADNGEYRVEASVVMTAQESVPYAPFLDDSTIGTAIFFIMEQFPTFEGVVLRSDTNEIVTEFSGKGGGEFAWRKSPIFNWRSDFGCWLNWSGKFSSGMP